LLQQKIYRGFYGLAAFTLFRSEFKDKQGIYAASSWDNHFTTALTAGKKFPRNWEVGPSGAYLPVRLTHRTTPLPQHLFRYGT
jgi:hypothetical protein